MEKNKKILVLFDEPVQTFEHPNKDIFQCICENASFAVVGLDFVVELYDDIQDGLGKLILRAPATSVQEIVAYP